MERLWDPPLTSGSQSLHRAPQKDRPADSPPNPRLWLRYVDDTSVVWPHGQEELEHFHEHLNVQHNSIWFTVEHEENRLAFLDSQHHAPEDHHRSAQMYVGLGQLHLQLHLQTVRTQTPAGCLPSQ